MPQYQVQPYGSIRTTTLLARKMKQPPYILIAAALRLRAGVDFNAMMFLKHMQRSLGYTCGNGLRVPSLLTMMRVASKDVDNTLRRRQRPPPPPRPLI